MSPEQLFGQGQSLSTDYWSFGCLLYELLVGFTPFHGITNVEEIHANILVGITDSLLRPITDQWGRDLIRRLLQHSEESRLGTGAEGIHDIISHRWFLDNAPYIEQLRVGKFPESLDVFWRPDKTNTNVERIMDVYANPQGEVHSSRILDEDHFTADVDSQERSTMTIVENDASVSWTWAF